MSSITWSPQSIRDLAAIRAYVAEDSPLYAGLVVQRIVAAVERLDSFPASGRVVPERESPALREIVLRPYRIVYRLGVDKVEIVTVFRSSRLFPESA